MQNLSSICETFAAAAQWLRILKKWKKVQKSRIHGIGQPLCFWKGIIFVYKHLNIFLLKNLLAGQFLPDYMPIPGLNWLSQVWHRSVWLLTLASGKGNHHYVYVHYVYFHYVYSQYVYIH